MKTADRILSEHTAFSAAVLPVKDILAAMQEYADQEVIRIGPRAWETSRISKLQNSEVFMNGAEILIKYKPPALSMSKMAEELGELLTKTLQRINDPKKVSREEFMEELVDVQMHLLIFESIFNDPKENEEIVALKTAKMVMSEDFNQYLEQHKNAKTESPWF